MRKAISGAKTVVIAFFSTTLPPYGITQKKNFNKTLSLDIVAGVDGEKIEARNNNEDAILQQIFFFLIKQQQIICKKFKSFQESSCY